MAEELRTTDEEKKRPLGVDAELEEYRNLIELPDRFEEGFNSKTVLGAFFVGLIMIPASIYLGLVVGASIGSAAEWVTIILFTEVARRSFLRLRKQEVFILFYVAGSLTAMMGTGMSGGPFSGLIWNQYLVQSPAAKGFQIAHQIPTWVVPQPGSPAIVERTFFHVAWAYPILLLVLGQVIGRLQWTGLGYVLFRVASDVERLPFPMAPIGVMGVTALAEHSQKQESWRWHVFSTGSVIGLAWGFFYVFVPILTGAVLSKPIQLIPIPWIELTTRTEKILPGAATGIATDAGAIIFGTVIPFWGVIGEAVASFSSMLINPQLLKKGLLPLWEPGMDTVEANFAATRNFWLAARIGITLAIFVIGIYEVIRNLVGARRSGAVARRALDGAKRDRGDWPVSIAVGMFLLSIVIMIVICRVLIPNFPMWWLFFFGFLYTPLMSYINARLIGLIGQSVDIPMVREMSFIVSGYKGTDIWFAPIPIVNIGGQAQFYRQVELTGTRMTSVLKAEMLMFPLFLICSFVFWQFIWRLAPIPSNAYPYAQKMWPLNALNQCLWMSATTDRPEMFIEAINKPAVIGSGLGFALVTYTVLVFFRMPTLFVYGLIRGAGNLPHYSILTLAGALLGRYYFEPKYGRKQWRQYAPVLYAGFLCGTGLVSMAGAALAMVVKSVRQLPY